MNKPRFLSVIFNMFFPANEGGSELESHHASTEVMVLCFTHALVDIWSIGTMVVIGQISIESPLSTNQQSFNGHGSDSYPGNLNLTLLHIIIWGLNPRKEDI